MKTISLRDFRKIPAEQRRGRYIGHYRHPDDTVDVYEEGDEQAWSDFLSHIDEQVKKDRPNEDEGIESIQEDFLERQKQAVGDDGWLNLALEFASGKIDSPDRKQAVELLRGVVKRVLNLGSLAPMK